jgi:uncharacterized protein (TIGR02118 family)
MIKVLWLIKRNGEVSGEEFQQWWVKVHGPEVMERQGKYLRKYVYRLPRSHAGIDDDSSKQAWDGVAEQWFDDALAFEASLAEPVSDEIVDDIRRHMGVVERFIFEETVLLP